MQFLLRLVLECGQAVREKLQHNTHIWLLRFISLVLISTLVSIVLIGISIEAGFRFWAKSKNLDLRLYRQELIRSDRLPSSLFVENNTLPYVLMKPNARALATTYDFSVVYSANSFGIRDKEYRLQKPVGKTRCLLFGDSFTFGEGVAYGERFADIIEEKISNFEVINFGMPGYGIDTELVLYKKVAQQFEHDCVVIAVNWLDAERNFSQIYMNGEIAIENAKPLATGVHGQTALLARTDTRLRTRWPLADSSYFIGYLQYQWLRQQLSLELAETDRQVWKILNEYLFRSRSEDERQETEKRTRAILNYFAQAVKQNQARFIIINIDPDEPMLFLNDINQQIIYLSYQENLELLSQTQPLRFTYDFHFNSRTHQLLGEWISADLDNLLRSKTFKSNE